MELVVVLPASEELEATAQLRCLGLTGTDIYILEFKISIKNFKVFRNVRKSIEKSGDISVL